MMKIRLLKHYTSNILVVIVYLHTAASSVYAESNSAPWVGETLWGVACSSLANRQGYGPYDYLRRLELAHNLQLVESAHFTPASENLVKGTQQKDPGPDLDYTLRAFPNHHRALNSAIKLRTQKDSGFYRTAGYPPAECYLQRAVYFSPKDGTSFMLYGMLLHRMGKHDMALEKYNAAELLQPDDLNLKYNMGLLFVDMRRYDTAREYADEVYSKGFPLQGLKRKLPDVK
jgi:tetratricopeptide (TPR) repeat protein